MTHNKNFSFLERKEKGVEFKSTIIELEAYKLKT